MKRLKILAALATTAVLFSASAGADDRGHRGWDRHHHSRDYRHDDRSDRYDRRWDDRRYIHARPNRYWAPQGHRYWNGYRDRYRGDYYYDGYYGNYYGGRYYYPPRYRHSGIDATVILTIPIW